jgi:hypothetical protein
METLLPIEFWAGISLACLYFKNARAASWPLICRRVACAYQLAHTIHTPRVPSHVFRMQVSVTRMQVSEQAPSVSNKHATVRTSTKVSVASTKLSVAITQLSVTSTNTLMEQHTSVQMVLCFYSVACFLIILWPYCFRFTFVSYISPFQMCIGSNLKFYYTNCQSQTQE